MSCKSLPVLSERALLSMQKPAQYLGGEQNSVLKDDHAINIHFALAFPDTYEVGMSHLGLQILYALINQDPEAWAERVFMPLRDMEQLLRDEGRPLTSLESKRPLSEFDILGISLQYELCGTNILAMLELGGIARYAAEREDDDPIVIGGGPYAYHAEPFAPFFDAFFLGDAEEAIAEVVRVVREWKARRKTDGERTSRESLLADLHRIEGVYVPALFEPEYDGEGKLSAVKPLDDAKPVVVRRLLPTMAGAPYPKNPIVPNVNTVHNRLSLEVMRGCVRGCRFCQAGYLYRPQRERSPEEILEMIEQALPATGYEELSLLSLSTADYCSIVPLLKTLMDRYGQDDRLAISFPSTRVDALKPEVLEQVQRVRRTGFTIAPEAGTQRMRDVINKGVTDEQILETCGNVFRMGWTGIKLYFMLGLPTETDDDLRGIVDIAARIKALPEARGRQITVSVSTHVPKPHTPFQWVEQIPPSEVIRRQRLLAEGLQRIKVNFRYHDAFSSFLEGVFARGDRRLARVVERAYELGGRLDGWTEHLSEEIWTNAFLDCGVDPLSFLRERGETEVLPWAHLSCGIPQSYFLKEYKRAIRSKVTPDCLLTSCSVCGTCDYDVTRNVLFPRGETEEVFNRLGLTGEDSQQVLPIKRVRIQYRKTGALRFIGHLELVQLFQRAARRANLPLAYSRGYHPMPRMAFGPPLQLGIESSTEYCDFFLTQPMAAETVEELLNFSLPRDIRVVFAEDVPLNAPSLQQLMVGGRYRLTWHMPPTGALAGALHSAESGIDLANCERALEFAVRELRIERGRPAGEKASSGGESDGPYVELGMQRVKERSHRHAKGKDQRTFNLRDFISDIALVCRPSAGAVPVSVEFSIRALASVAGPRPFEVASSISGLQVGEYALEKIETFFADTGEVTPEREPVVVGA